MTEQEFIKKLKSYEYVYNLLIKEEKDLPNWIFRNFIKK